VSDVLFGIVRHLVRKARETVIRPHRWATRRVSRSGVGGTTRGPFALDA
jgi:hypothetical protein